MSWCLLPDLVVWMIKDRLGVVSNARMASVCRNWWYASLSYPNHESAPPICIMQRANNKNSSSCYDFICTPTSQREEEKFTVNLPDFDEAELVFSKHGWLLMKRKYSLFLFNPFTKVRINLPDVKDSFGHFAGSFSFSTSLKQPQCVFIFTYLVHGILWLRIAHPGDKTWTEYNYVNQRIEYVSARNVLAIGQKVFCFDNHGGLFIYDLVTQIWKEVDRPTNDYFGWYMVEHQGEIMKLRVIYDGGSGQPCRGSFRIFRYNDDSTAWERLSYDDVKVKDTSWFLNTQGRCFSAKGHGFKLYYLKKHFVRCPLNICRRRRAMLPSDTFHARFHDMIHGASHSLFPYIFRRPAWWVNLA
jgi:hypothetical protein